jgi:hypothetical protein
MENEYVQNLIFVETGSFKETGIKQEGLLIFNRQLRLLNCVLFLYSIFAGERISHVNVRAAFGSKTFQSL